MTSESDGREKIKQTHRWSKGKDKDENNETQTLVTSMAKKGEVESNVQIESLVFVHTVAFTVLGLYEEMVLQYIVSYILDISSPWIMTRATGCSPNQILYSTVLIEIPKKVHRTCRKLKLAATSLLDWFVH